MNANKKPALKGEKPVKRSMVPVVDQKLMKWILQELGQVRGYDFDPCFLEGKSVDVDWTGLGSYTHTSQNKALVSKNAHLGYLSDTRSAAIVQHHIDEARCAVYNELLMEPPGFIGEVSKLIARILSNFWRYFADAPVRFGPGVALLDAATKRSGYTPDKLENPCSTLKLYEFMRRSELWGENPFFFAWMTRPGNNVSVLRESVEEFFTVPKDCTTDRGCSKQPSVNMTVQLQVGYAIRMCLREAGILIESEALGAISIENQASYHRELLPKMWEKIATIDLKSASNTISKELVRLLLPSKVYNLLDAARCSSICIDEQVYELERFSAMGNGFTFELESLIFYAIATLSGGSVRHFRSGNCSVFGDDILVPIDAFQNTIKNLELCGFEINKSKSFGSGPFRESCGMDVFNGVPCRPVYLKDFTGPLGFVSLHNLIVKLAKVGNGYDVSYRRLLMQMRAKAPLVPIGPVADGDDTYFHEPTFDKFLPLTFKAGNVVITDRNQWGHKAIRLRQRSVPPHSDHYFVYMWMALGFDSQGYGIRDAISIRGLRFKKSERIMPSPWV